VKNLITYTYWNAYDDIMSNGGDDDDDDDFSIGLVAAAVALLV
jgi:hypothetical protein